MRSHDRPLISDLLDAEDMTPADLDALPRTLLRRSLRRLLDETGEPRGHFLWFPNQSSDSGVAPRSSGGGERRPTEGEGMDLTDVRRPKWPEPR